MYMSTDLSLASIALSRGNVKIAVNKGKKPQNTEMKNNSNALNFVGNDLSFTFPFARSIGNSAGFMAIKGEHPIQEK